MKKIKPVYKSHVINLLGGPGAGKSTTRALLFGLLKLHGINSEEAPEFAKDCSWEKREETLRDQLYVFGKQAHRLFRVRDDVEIIVCDSPLILSIVYARKYGSSKLSFEQHVIDSFNEYNNHNFMLIRKKAYNLKGRNQTEDEAKIIDGEVNAILDEFDIPYTVFDGDYKAANRIADYILREFFSLPLIYKISKNSD